MMIWNRSVPIATVVGTPRTKISTGIRMNPPPAPSSPAMNPIPKPIAIGTNTDMRSISDTGREM